VPGTGRLLGQRGRSGPAILGRPLHLPTVARGEACPVTPGQNARNGCAFGLQFGSGPVSMTIGHRGDPGDGTVILGATRLVRAGERMAVRAWIPRPVHGPRAATAVPSRMVSSRATFLMGMARAAGRRTAQAHLLRCGRQSRQSWLFWPVTFLRKQQT
jgi:hypothetical protein